MIWLGLIWLIGAAALLALAVGYAASLPLMRRRAPDPTETPSDYGMDAQDVTFASRDGLALGGWWIPAASAARGTVVICSGQNGSLDKDVLQAVPLHRAGFDVLLFDWRAHGRSEGNTVTLGALEQADLFGALDFLQRERGRDAVGVLGLSMGAGVALLVAAQDARIRALALDGAWPRLDGLLTGYLRQRAFPTPLARAVARLTLLAAALRTQYQIHRANPLDWAERVRAPALLIHGAADPFVSGAEVEALAARLGGEVEVWQVVGAGHREAFVRCPDEYNGRVVGWFERHLTSETKAPSPSRGEGIEG